jgi:hypothetical protein
MALKEHSFAHLLPTFLIPAGTQVVLKVDKPLPNGSVRARGSVAVVTDSPSDNQYAYTLRFADGQTVKANFRELAIRRKEVEDHLALTDEDLRPFIVYRCQVGSHAFGLAGEDSDEDDRVAFAPVVAAEPAGPAGVRCGTPSATLVSSGPPACRRAHSPLRRSRARLPPSCVVSSGGGDDDRSRRPASWALLAF